MHPSLQFESDVNLTELHLAHVARFLEQQNEKVQLTWAPQSMHVLARIGDEIVGGIFGASNWDWLYIKLLAVDPSLRGQGIGSSLIKRMEEMALSRGCVGVHVDTFSFQALHFYERCGYNVFGHLPDYPKPHSRYFLCKRLQNG